MAKTKTLGELKQEAADKWAHPALMRLWIVLSMPDYEDGEPVLHQSDIEEMAACVAELNQDFNHPEIKALRQRLSEAAQDETNG